MVRRLGGLACLEVDLRVPRTVVLQTFLLMGEAGFELKSRYPDTLMRRDRDRRPVRSKRLYRFGPFASAPVIMADVL